MIGLTKIALLSREDQQQMNERMGGPAAWDQVGAKQRQDFQQASIKQETELAKRYQGQLYGLDPSSPRYQQIRGKWDEERESLINQLHQEAKDPQSFLDAHHQEFPKQPYDPMAGVRNHSPRPTPMPTRAELHATEPLGKKLFPILHGGGAALGLAGLGAGAGYLATQGFNHRNEANPNGRFN
jgi:hypothetical protein